MAEEASSSTAAPPKDDKPVIVRVKRKSYQSPLEAFWLEINERPVKRPLLDFEKLSIDDSATKAEELKRKKLFVQHVDTVSSSDVAVDILQSIVASKPNSVDALNSKAKLEDQRRSNKTDNKQKQLLVKAKETQELLAKNARFKQIWKSRKRINTAAASDDALHDMCRLYDVERVDVGETSEVHEQEDEEERRLMNSFLPLLQEFIPSAAEEIESDIERHSKKQASKDDYVYDLYAVKDNNISLEESTFSPFPFVQVDDDDDFYDGPDNSDYETDDSNAEDNPLNDYPDEEEDEDEDGSKSTEEDEDEDEDCSKSSESSKSETIRDLDLSEDDIMVNEDDYEYGGEDDDDDESYAWQ